MSQYRSDCSITVTTWIQIQNHKGVYIRIYDWITLDLISEKSDPSSKGKKVEKPSKPINSRYHLHIRHLILSNIQFVSMKFIK